MTDDELYGAIRAADANGDKEGVQKLTEFVKQRQASSASNTPPPNPNAPVPEMNQEIPMPQKHSLKEAAANIGVNAAIGAGMSAVMPEVLMGAGGLMTGTPLAPAAPFVFGAGEAMRIHRTMSILGGAAVGALGTAAGEGIRAAGGSEKAILGAELVGGMMTPSASLVARMVPGPHKTAWNAVRALAAKAPAVEAKTAAESKKILQDTFGDKIPENDLHLILKMGAEADQKATDQAANDLMTQAYRKAEILARSDQKAADAALEEGKRQADTLRKDFATRTQRLQAITDGKMESAERVMKQAAPARAQIGTERDVSDIGNDIRKATLASQGPQLEARTAAYKETQKLRDAVVAQNESQGRFLDKEPGMQQLKQELNTKLLATQKGREASMVTLPDGTKQGVARVNEPGVTRAYQSVLDSINNKRVQTGVTDEGAPTYQTFKTTFEALDHVRRKLGDAISGGDKEGYGALGQNIARDLYGKISKIQQDYAGPLQKTLQEDYADASGDLVKFSSSSGKKVTAVDRLDPEAFAQDPSKLPAHFFKSQQSVRDLAELTGSPVMVERAAKDYTAKQLGGLSAEQVTKWARSNSDWTREVPGLGKSVDEYATKLAGIEKREAQLKGTADAARVAKQQAAAQLPDQLAKVKADSLKEASLRVGSRVEEQAAMTAEAAKAGQALKDAAKQRADAVIKTGFAVKDVRSLLTNGTRDEISTAVKYVAGATGGKEALEGSIRHTLAATSPQKWREVWDGSIKQVLADGQLLEPEVLAKLDRDVQEAFRKYEPAKARTLAQKYFQAALITALQAAIRSDSAVPEQSKRLPWQK